MNKKTLKNISGALNREQMKSVIGAGTCSVSCKSGSASLECSGTCTADQAHGTVSCTPSGGGATITTQCKEL